MLLKLTISILYLILLFIDIITFIAAGASRAVASEQSPESWIYIAIALVAFAILSLLMLWVKNAAKYIIGSIYSLSSFSVFIWIIVQEAYQIGQSQIIVISIKLLLLIVSLILLYRLRVSEFHKSKPQ